MAWTCDPERQALVEAAPDANLTQTMLSRTELFHGVGLRTVAAISKWLQATEFRQGQTIYDEGDRADRLYIMITGKVKIRRRCADGKETLVSVMGPSDMFGVVSMLDAGTRATTASASTDVWAVTCDRTVLRALTIEHPQIYEQLLRVLARRLRRSDNTLADLFSTDGPGRVAKQLLQLAQRFGTAEGDAVRVTHDLTQEEIAQLAGSSRETVNKTLSNFINRGWILVDGKSVLIRQPARLARRAR